MIKLIRIEFFKLYHNSLTRYFLLIYFLLHLILNYIFSNDIKMGIEINLPEMGLYSFPNIWNTLTYIDSYLKIFLAFILVNSFVSEFQNATFKQNIIDGLSRNQWLSSKFISFLLLIFTSTLILFISGLILGNHFTEGDFSLATQIEHLLLFFAENLLFISFAFLLALLFKNSIFTFLGMFIWNIIEGVMSLAFKISNTMSTHKGNVNLNTELNSTKNSWDFLPLEAAGNLIDNPMRKTDFGKLLGMHSEYLFPTHSFIVTAIYISIFIGLSYLYINKKDW